MRAMNATCDILLPVPLEGTFEYSAASATITPGMLAEVPFGKRTLTGLVLGPGSGQIAENKLRPVGELSALPPLPENFRHFISWAARYNMVPPGLLLKMTLAGKTLPQRPTGETRWRLGEIPSKTITSKRQAALNLLATQGSCTTQEFKTAGISLSILQVMAALGWIIKEESTLSEAVPCPDPDFHRPKLNPAQEEAAARLCAALAETAPTPLLLEGVTGSGKTEVYAEAIAAALRLNRQILVLMPEIALTTAMLSRFTARFGAQPTIWHSDLAPRQRRSNWWAIAEGRAKLIVGARSALFLPYPNLGLIIVDEEHEAAYKQEEGVIYHARDMAVARAHHAKIPVILASATPSLESHANAESGRYKRVILPERFGGASMPLIHSIDMRTENLPATRWLSTPLIAALKETLQAKEQAMLFLNRRGYAPLTLCRACGHRLQCPQCAAWLTSHKQNKRLQCHYCGHASAMPQACPACHTEEKFASCGPGVERIAEEVATLLPSARTAIMSSDLVQGAASMSTLLKQVHDGAIDILIGTQIMAKGYHFPAMTLVGIIDADLGLSGGDPRAAERCYQLLQQVAGRAGRADRPGRAYLQTYQPEHPVIQALVSGQRAAFIAAELTERESYALPPYRRLAGLILSGPDMRQVDEMAAAIARLGPRDERLRILGPAPAPLAYLRGQFRRRLLLVATKEIHLQEIMRHWLKAINLPKGLKLQIDIDPYSFY